MDEIVIINGPPGVGKTTVARLLARALPGTVCILGDDLRAFAPEDARMHLGGGSTYRAGAALAREYIRMGAPRVILDYVFSRPQHLSHLEAGLEASKDLSVHLFTLWAPLDVVQNRERARTGRKQLGEAVSESWHEIASNRPALGEFVDNNVTTAEETARHLSTLLATGVGRLGGLPNHASDTEQGGG